jgi:hypothetical protein
VGLAVKEDTQTENSRAFETEQKCRFCEHILILARDQFVLVSAALWFRPRSGINTPSKRGSIIVVLTRLTKSHRRFVI